MGGRTYTYWKGWLWVALAVSFIIEGSSVRVGAAGGGRRLSSRLGEVVGGGEVEVQVWYTRKNKHLDAQRNLLRAFFLLAQNFSPRLACRRRRRRRRRRRSPLDKAKLVFWVVGGGGIT